MHKYRVIIYKGNADTMCNYIAHDFFIGKVDEKDYVDYLSEYGLDTAEDMKFINIAYEKKNNIKTWWKHKLLWNTDSYFKNLQDIRKDYELVFQIGTQVIILATARNH